jgi:predicted transcriptional regulator
VSQQITDQGTKAVVLILLVVSGGLTSQVSGVAQPYRFISNSGTTALANQLMKTYNSELLSASQNGAQLVVLGSDREVSTTTVPSSYANEMESQFFQGILTPMSSQQLVRSPNAGILLLRDAENGQTLVVIISLGQNVESNRVSPLPFLFAPLLQVWLDSERRRSRFRIYVEILDLLKRGPMTPYEVAFHLRLNRKKAREYLEFLKINSFLEFMEYEGRAAYNITPVGKTFVENLKSVLEAERRL